MLEVLGDSLAEVVLVGDRLGHDRAEMATDGDSSGGDSGDQGARHLCSDGLNLGPVDVIGHRPHRAGHVVGAARRGSLRTSAQSTPRSASATSCASLSRSPASGLVERRRLGRRSTEQPFQRLQLLFRCRPHRLRRGVVTGQTGGMFGLQGGGDRLGLGTPLGGRDHACRTLHRVVTLRSGHRHRLPSHRDGLVGLQPRRGELPGFLDRRRRRADRKGGDRRWLRRDLDHLHAVGRTGHHRAAVSLDSPRRRAQHRR